jgi:transposase-like protein
MKITSLAHYLNDEEAATDLIEAMRWGKERCCPYCACDKSYRLNVARIKRRRYKCAECRKQFTVSVGTIFEGSHMPFGKWLYVIYKMCVAKKGVSALQLQRELGCTYKAAWFMCHRVRCAMGKEPLAALLSGIVEADETYVGNDKGSGKRGRSKGKKTPVLALVSRSGEARSFVIPDAKSHTLEKLIINNVEVKADVMTDGWQGYKGLKVFYDYNHQSIDHNKQFVRGIVHTNFAESYFSLLKRGVIGTFHHISAQHMQSYLNEFDYRWTHRKAGQDAMFAGVIRGAAGKRLMYKTPAPR